jgi:hypothetical protein
MNELSTAVEPWTAHTKATSVSSTDTYKTQVRNKSVVLETAFVCRCSDGSLLSLLKLAIITDTRRLLYTTRCRHVIILTPCTVHLLLFCTMTNKCTIISQIITTLHVSTLSCHPQTACNQYLAKLHQYFECRCW